MNSKQENWQPFHLETSITTDIDTRTHWLEAIHTYIRATNSLSDFQGAEAFLLDHARENTRDGKLKIPDYGLYQEHKGRTLREFFAEHAMQPITNHIEPPTPA